MKRSLFFLLGGAALTGAAVGAIMAWRGRQSEDPWQSADPIIVDGHVRPTGYGPAGIFGTHGAHNGYAPAHKFAENDNTPYTQQGYGPHGMGGYGPVHQTH
ncbi:hypothetical protein [Boudabousia tangfeifanii]|nr:hypothetical protein [Boudabousia tangfeifanii]